MTTMNFGLSACTYDFMDVKKQKKEFLKRPSNSLRVQGEYQRYFWNSTDGMDWKSLIIALLLHLLYAYSVEPDLKLFLFTVK